MCVCVLNCVCAKKDTFKMALILFIVLTLLASQAFFFYSKEKVSLHFLERGEGGGGFLFTCVFVSLS